MSPQPAVVLRLDDAIEALRLCFKPVPQRLLCASLKEAWRNLSDTCPWDEKLDGSRAFESVNATLCE